MQTASVMAKDLPAGKMVGIRVGDRAVLLANVGGQFYAIGDVCTHRGCTVSEGTLTGAIAQCPCHGSRFDVRTGAVVGGPAKKPEQSFKVEVSGDQVIVTV